MKTIERGIGGFEGLRAGEVAEAAGVNRETLRYYERRGLLAQPVRSPGGHRLYPTEAVTMLRIIKAAQRLGFTLDEVASLLEVSRHRHGQRSDTGLQSRAREKLVEVEDRIRDLQTIRENLVAALDAGCDDLTECANAACCPIPFVALTEIRTDVSMNAPAPPAAGTENR
ncbi:MULTISPECIES: MerR family transcriptional regulator [unclassified Nocardioides]|uniref:MerR family transcriptional regulator n=1 Tax=unclassified Nocardioides TaxID=2615069 RepID=UPI003609C2F5